MRVGDSPEITLVLPAYNEADNITQVLRESVQALEELGVGWEIIVVDNHSADATAERVREFLALEPRVRLIVHEENRFYSGSCQTALRESRGRYVAIMDSDGQFTARDLPAFLEALHHGANLVFGWRRERQDPLGRKVMSWVFNLLGRFWLGYPWHDLNVGIRMFDRRFVAAAAITHRINLANPELYVCARRAHLEVAEVPIHHAERKRGASCHDFRKMLALFLQVERHFRALHKQLHAPAEQPVSSGCSRRAA